MEEEGVKVLFSLAANKEFDRINPPSLARLGSLELLSSGLKEEKRRCSKGISGRGMITEGLKA